MPARPAIDGAQSRLVLDLGQRLRLARLRRRWSASEVAARAGITRPTLQRLENGEAAPTVGTLVKVLDVLGLAQDMVLLARDDLAGRRQLDDALPSNRARQPALKRVREIRLADFPQLRALAWHLPDKRATVTPSEAFQLYERNWRHVDRQSLSDREARLIERLTRTEGKGVMLV